MFVVNDRMTQLEAVDENNAELINNKSNKCQMRACMTSADRTPETKCKIFKNKN